MCLQKSQPMRFQSICRPNADLNRRLRCVRLESVLAVYESVIYEWIDQRVTEIRPNGALGVPYDLFVLRSAWQNA
jgi:hypothetical protein